MKFLFILSLFIVGQILAEECKQIIDNAKFCLHTTSTWYEFRQNYNDDFKKEIWAWISFITFKSKEAINLKELKLMWDGEKIKTQKISASLYQKKETSEEILKPIQENLICDGKWDKENQQIYFNLDEKLIATNKYYLVLNFPKKISSLLKNGKFILKDSNSLTIKRIH